MIFDILVFGGIGAFLGVVGHILFLEMKATGKIKPAVSATEAKIEGLGQIVVREGQAATERTEAFFKTFDPETFLHRIETVMSQAGDTIVQNLTEAAAKISTLGDPAPIQAALDAEKADHEADLTNIAAAAGQVTAAVDAAAPAPAEQPTG